MLSLLCKYAGYPHTLEIGDYLVTTPLVKHETTTVLEYPTSDCETAANTMPPCKEIGPILEITYGVVHKEACVIVKVSSTAAWAKEPIWAPISRGLTQLARYSSRCSFDRQWKHVHVELESDDEDEEEINDDAHCEHCNWSGKINAAGEKLSLIHI